MAARKTRLRLNLKRHIQHSQRPRSPLWKSPWLLSAALLALHPTGLLRAEELLSQQAPAPEKPKSPPGTHELDWVPAEQLTPSQRAEIPAGCCGAYVEPERTDVDAGKDPQQAPLQAESDRAKMLQETLTIMEGNVKLTQGYRQLQADRVELDQNTHLAEIEGHIRLRQPGLLITSDTAIMNTASRYATLTDARFVLHDLRARGSAAQLTHQENDVLILDDGIYTRCEPGSNAWLLQGSEIEIDPNTQQGYGRHMRLTVKGVPIFYSPYMQFPVGSERQSGFLFPFISTSDSGGGGLNVGIPYYFNLAPNYDLTATPRHIDDRGEMLELEFRHLSPYFSTVVNAAHLSDDEGGKDNDDEKRLEEVRIQLESSELSEEERELLEEELGLLEEKIDRFVGEDRWLLNIDQVGGLSERWGTRIDFTRVSDIDYFRDLDTASLSVNSTTHLKRLGQFDYRTDNWLLTAKAEQYQTIVDEDIIKPINTPYRQEPSLNANGSYRFGDWMFELNNEYVRFDHKETDNEILTDNKLTGDRIRFDYRTGWEKEWTWGFFKPALYFKYLNYELDDNRGEDIEETPEVFVPQGSVDTGLYFERDGSLFGKGYLHTFEPRLFYFYSDFEDQSLLIDQGVNFDSSELTFGYSQLFRDSRFAGGDRIDDANRLSVGLTTRLIEGDTGIERFTFSLGQIFYFQDRRITLNTVAPRDPGDPDTEETVNHSEIATTVSGRIGDSWRLNSDLMYDEEEQEMSSGNISLHYMDEHYCLFNVGYRYVRQAGQADRNDIDNDGDIAELLKTDIDQAEASLLWPLFGNVSLIGRYHKDFTNDRELESFAGLEYNSCCYRVRAVWRRWLDNDLVNLIDERELEFDEGIFFEFQFKGLGGTGTTLNQVLSEGIVGYERREQNLQ